MTGDCYGVILQVLDLTRANGDEPEIYRLWLSDGRYFRSYFFLSPSLNHLIKKLTEFTIILVKQYIPKIVQYMNISKQVLIITELDVLKYGDKFGHRIGEPVSLDDINKQNINASFEPQKIVFNSSSNSNALIRKDAKDSLNCSL